MALHLSKLVGFEWDMGNVDKNRTKHGVEDRECEEIFSNKPLIIFEDKSHSQQEERWGALGRTNNGRRLAIYFTIRNNKIRVISARDQSQKDRAVYMSMSNGNQKQEKRGDKTKI